MNSVNEYMRSDAPKNINSHSIVLNGLKNITTPQMVVRSGPINNENGAWVSLRAEIRVAVSLKPIIRSIAPKRNIMIPAKNDGKITSTRPKIRLETPFMDRIDLFVFSSGLLENINVMAPRSMSTAPIVIMMVLTAESGQMTITMPSMADMMALE
jgi:hypothetical protein